MSNWLLPTWPAERLGLLRIAIGVYVIQDIARTRRGVLALGFTDPKLWDPVGVCTLLAAPLDPAVFGWVHDATLLAAILFTLGIGWRVTGPVFAALLLFLWTYRVSWQMLYHVHHLAMLHVLVLGAAPAAARALSVDAWVARRRGRPAAVPSWEFGWPVRLVCIVTAISYLLAGLAKVDLAGWRWADGRNLLHQVAYDGVYKAVLAQPSDEPYATIAFAFAHPWIMAPLAFFALAVELGAPLALVHRRVGQVWVAATFGMHWGIHLFMNLVFPYPIFGFAFLSFFEVERLIPRRFRADPPGATPS